LSSCQFINGESGKVLNILVGVLHHLLEPRNDLTVQNRHINVGLHLFNDLRDAESDVGDGVFHRFQENWNDELGHLVLVHVRHHPLQRQQVAHPVVVPLLVNIVVFNDLGDVVGYDPVLSELFCDFFGFLDAHFSDTGGGVGQVGHEDVLQVLGEHFSSEDLADVSNELEHCHPHSPLRILGHVAQGGQELRTQHVWANDLSSLDHSLSHIQAHIRVVVLDQVHQDRDDLLNCGILANDVSHLAQC